MKAIFRLALRNLKEHKAKTIIISLFLIFGVAIVVIGNSFLESVNRGLEKDFRANYTGDLVITPVPDKGMRIDIFGIDSTTLTTDIPQIPALPDLDRIQKIISEHPEITESTKLISAKVMLAKGIEVDLSNLDDDIGLMDYPFAILFAGEQDTYREMFQNLTFLEGTFPEAGTNEVIIDTRLQRSFEKTYHDTLNLGDTVLLMGANTRGIIREGKICGIFKPANENSAMFQAVYCNPELARSFADLTYGSSFKEELSTGIDLDLASLSEDDLFGDSADDFFSDDSSLNLLRENTTDFSDILGDTTKRDELNKTDDGAWNFILTKVDNPHRANKIVAEMNEIFKEENINARALNWKRAAASYSDSVDGIGFIFNLLIIILAVVVFIIIMNTMTVSVIERTGEIGTMRALGAEKKFVKLLFYTEAISLTVISSIIGIILAFIAMAIFNSLNITITNEIAKMILGGGLLHFSPTPAIIFWTFIVAILASVISNLYPVHSALRITPLKALSKGSD